MFRCLPDEIEFDIEVKYAWDDINEKELCWKDRNEYLDTILDVFLLFLKKRIREIYPV